MYVRLDDEMDFGEAFFLLATVRPDQGDGWNVRPAGWSQWPKVTGTHLYI
jgi:hypothetical protein